MKALEFLFGGCQYKCHQFTCLTFFLKKPKMSFFNNSSSSCCIALIVSRHWTNIKWKIILFRLFWAISSPNWDFYNDGRDKNVSGLKKCTWWPFRGAITLQCATFYVQTFFPVFFTIPTSRKTQQYIIPGGRGVPVARRITSVCVWLKCLKLGWDRRKICMK